MYEQFIHRGVTYSVRKDPLTSHIVEDRGYDTPCWIWQRILNHDGYGRIWFRKNEKRTHAFAHRLYYEHHVGEIPEELQLDHLCRNRACVNPAHLEPVTGAENVRRGGRSILTEADVIDIKRRSGESDESLGRKFGVQGQTIASVRKGRTWKEVAA